MAIKEIKQPYALSQGIDLVPAGMAENFGNVFFQLCICFVSPANLPRPHWHVSPSDLP